MDVSNTINCAIKAAQEEVNKYTYPVFISDQNSKPDLIASSVVIVIKNKTFLVTASHVLTQVLSIGSQFIIGANGKYVSIIGEFIYSSHKDTDHFDVAYIELSDEFVKCNNLSVLHENKLLVSNEFSRPHIAFIHGFPNSINKQSKALYQTTSFKVKGYAYGGVIMRDFSHWGSCEKREDVHTCMTYGKTSDNNTPKLPKGISGGGLWIIPDSAEPKTIYLNSIFIEYHKNYCVCFGTKINQVVSFINETNTYQSARARPSLNGAKS